MTADREQFLLLKEDRTNSSTQRALGSNEFPTENLLSDPHSPLPLHHCAFDLRSEPLRSNTADAWLRLWWTLQVFLSVVFLFPLFSLCVCQPLQINTINICSVLFVLVTVGTSVSIFAHADVIFHMYEHSSTKLC